MKYHAIGLANNISPFMTLFYQVATLLSVGKWIVIDTAIATLATPSSATR